MVGLFHGKSPSLNGDWGNLRSPTSHLRVLHFAKESQTLAPATASSGHGTVEGHHIRLHLSGWWFTNQPQGLQHQIPSNPAWCRWKTSWSAMASSHFEVDSKLPQSTWCQRLEGIKKTKQECRRWVSLSYEFIHWQVNWKPRPKFKSRQLGSCEFRKHNMCKKQVCRFVRRDYMSMINIWSYWSYDCHMIICFAYLDHPLGERGLAAPRISAKRSS